MIENFNYGHQDNSTLDNLMEGFQLIGFDWRYIYVNQSIVKQSKYSSKEDLLGYTMMEKYPGIENTELFKILRQCMSGRVAKNMENEFTFPDRSQGWFELRIQPVPKGIFILSMDISERKKAERAKEEHIRGLEEMIFMTSHKVRLPVAHILGIASLLDNSILSADEINKVAGYMKQSALSLDVFIKDLTLMIHDQKLKAGSRIAV